MDKTTAYKKAKGQASEEPYHHPAKSSYSVHIVIYEKTWILVTDFVIQI